MKEKIILKISIFLVLIFSATPAWSQLNQRVRGALINAASGQAVGGAILILENSQQRYSTVSDAAGNFAFAEVAPGHYRLLVQHINFALYLEPELLVEASKSLYRSIALQESISALDEVEIAVSLPPPTLNRRGFTVAQTQRYAATFFDPARLVLSQPGVTQANDQANHVIVHGLSPAGIQWRLQGLPILNPNHLANAGTPRDRAAVSGGGVNMLSGQLMDNSAFITGALPPRFGNAVSGVFDIRLRPGNMLDREHTLQASLLGIDLATEGPIKKEKSAYLLNYRYSTVGLLSQLGVDFGGEEIHYQDLSASVYFDKTPIGAINFFFLGGTNSNERTPLEETDWKQDKDRLNIDYTASMGAIGVSQSLSLGTKFYWQNGVSFSALENERLELWPETSPTPLPLFRRLEDRHQARQLSAFTRLQGSVSKRINTEMGLQLIHHQASVFAAPLSENTEKLAQDIRYTLTQPYLQAEFLLHPSLALEAGLRLSHLSRNNQSQLEPYTKLVWQAGEKQLWQLSWARQGQVYSDHQLLLSDKQQGLISSQYAGLGWSYRFSPQLGLSAEVFYQQLKALPGTESDLAWNYLSELYLPLRGQGQASTYGLDVNLNRDFYKGWYYQLSGSLFEASYAGGNGKRHASPFNSQWAGSFTGGREWTKEKAVGQRSWSLNLRLHSRGGYRYTPIDVAASQEAGREIMLAGEPFSAQLPVYYTADLRLSHTRQKKGYTRIWSLDIQNVANRRNIGWYYYDFLQQQVNTQEQLGIIPVLAYRIQF